MGQLPQIFTRGSHNIMVLYDYNSNAILAIFMKSQHKSELLRACVQLHEYLTNCWLKPVQQRLDNKAPHTLKWSMMQQQVKYQLVPPHIHCCSAVEQAIATFKEHFIAELCTTDKQFLLQLWDYLLPQAALTLNLLHDLHLNPHLSAYKQLNSTHNFNKLPLAPPGTKVIVHVKHRYANHGRHMVSMDGM